MRFLLMSVLMVSLFLAPCIVNAAISPDDPDLLLYLPFDGDVDDYSKSALETTLVGDADFVEGKHGEALDFSESGEVKAPHIPFEDKSFTVCMWVKPKLAGTDSQVIFGQHQAGQTNVSLHFRIYASSGNVRMGFYSNDLNAAAAVKKDEWVHMAFWLDIDKVKRRIYINGKPIAEDAGVAGIEYKGTTGDTYIGAWRANYQRFNGTIDEVQVWNRALSDDEILDSMERLSSIINAVDASGKLATAWGTIKVEH